jgi:hypothetical protein
MCNSVTFHYDCTSSAATAGAGWGGGSVVERPAFALPPPPCDASGGTATPSLNFTRHWCGSCCAAWLWPRGSARGTGGCRVCAGCASGAGLPASPTPAPPRGARRRTRRRPCGWRRAGRPRSCRCGAASPGGGAPADPARRPTRREMGMWAAALATPGSPTPTWLRRDLWPLDRLKFYCFAAP